VRLHHRDSGLVAEGRSDEYGLPTFQLGALCAPGVSPWSTTASVEYELIDIAGTGEDARATAMAVTLLRSTGMLSRLGMAYRPSRPDR